MHQYFGQLDVFDSHSSGTFFFFQLFNKKNYEFAIELN